NFDLAPAGPVTFDGPVTLHLAASSAGFLLGRSEHIYAYIQDCAADGTNCVLLSATDVKINQWSLFAGWFERRLKPRHLNPPVAACCGSSCSTVTTCCGSR